MWRSGEAVTGPTVVSVYPVLHFFSSALRNQPLRLHVPGTNVRGRKSPRLTYAPQLWSDGEQINPAFRDEGRGTHEVNLESL